MPVMYAAIDEPASARVLPLRRSRRRRPRGHGRPDRARARAGLRARGRGLGHALVLSRIAQAYLLALEELRTSSFYDLELPFLTVNERGPAHLQRRLTAQLLAELARRDPRLAPPLPPQPRPGESSPLATAKKKGWWPFS